MTNSEINRLGEALRDGHATPENLIALDEYRRSFQPAIASLVSDWQTYIGSTSVFVQRPSKSTPSIIAKLRRQPTLKLTQVQDIAGLRGIFTDRYSQDVMTERLQSVFPDSKVIDRRVKPSYGYRAVHFVIRLLGRPVEVQLRTEIQHAWAHLSERLADLLGHDLKYGGGEVILRNRLIEISDRINELEQAAHDWNARHDQFSTFNRKTPFDSDMELVWRKLEEIGHHHLPP